MTVSINGTTGLITAGSSSSGGSGIATNTALGGDALVANTTGASNTAIGNEALKINTTASNNTAVGYQAIYSGTTAQQNVAVGQGSLYSTTTGSFNSAVGRTSLYFNTTGASNVAMGNASLESNTTGSFNVGLGQSALGSNTTASNNTAVGYQAGYSNTTARWNTFIGSQAGYGVTTGEANTFVGNGYSPAGISVTTGSRNTIIGGYSGNNGGLDIRTASNHIVLSDGDGNPRQVLNGSGDLFVGKVSSNGAAAGFEYIVGASAYAAMTNTRTDGQGDLLYLNRQGSDGNLIRFAQAEAIEGSITVSGTTVSYNGGHLARWSQLPDGSKDDTILKGTVLTNLDDMCVWTKDGEQLPNEQLNKMKVSDVEGDTNVAGVFVNWTRDENCNTDDMNIAMTGDMIIRISQGVLVQKGDLLMSAGDGTAKPQGDDIRRSKTVAKVTSNHVTCTYADGSYCVPCVLMAC